MKKLSLLAICLPLSIVVKAQVTTPTNAAILPNQYVGYSGIPALNSKSLDLKNGFNNQPINFFTNSSGTNGIGNVTERMTIMPTGRVGLSNI